MDYDPRGEVLCNAAPAALQSGQLTAFPTEKQASGRCLETQR
jgi:hypothetical protein